MTLNADDYNRVNLPKDLKDTILTDINTLSTDSTPTTSQDTLPTDDGYSSASASSISIPGVPHQQQHQSTPLPLAAAAAEPAFRPPTTVPANGGGSSAVHAPTNLHISQTVSSSGSGRSSQNGGLGAGAESDGFYDNDKTPMADSSYNPQYINTNSQQGNPSGTTLSKASTQSSSGTEFGATESGGVGGGNSVYLERDGRHALRSHEISPSHSTPLAEQADGLVDGMGEETEDTEDTGDEGKRGKGVVKKVREKVKRVLSKTES